MSNAKTQTATVALKIWEAAPNYQVCLMDDGTVRIIGDVGAMRGIEARKLAYALMAAGAQS